MNNSSRASKPNTPEVHFPSEFDQQHYLNVMTNCQRWRTPSPSEKYFVLDGPPTSHNGPKPKFGLDQRSAKQIFCSSFDPSVAVVPMASLSHTSSAESLVLGEPLFREEPDGSSGSLTSPDDCSSGSLGFPLDLTQDNDKLPSMLLANKVKNSIENIDKISRSKKHRSTQAHSTSHDSLSPDKHLSFSDDDYHESSNNQAYLSSKHLDGTCRFEDSSDRPRNSLQDRTNLSLGHGSVIPIQFEDKNRKLTNDSKEKDFLTAKTIGSRSKESRIVLNLDSSRAATLTRTCKFGGYFRKIPDSGDLTVNELREMATRQQQHIENQQQLLVAREQRLKYLKQQEGRTSQVNMETERLRRLRERVEAQEAKLRRLRALRGQVDNSRLNAASLYSDLDAMRHLFSEKEKELVDAAAKVEELTRQLEDVRGGRGAGGSGAQNGGLTNSNQLQIHHQELEKLRRELLYRNSVNREASSRVSSQKDALTSRKEEISRIDKRIAELTQRLHRKRVLNQQLTTQISAATQAKQAQLKAVQQKALRDGKNDHSADNVNIEEHRTLEDISQFDRGKHDPKYQTLPYNTKFSSGVKGGPVSGPRGSYDNAGSENESNGSSSDTNPSQSASVVNNIRNSGLVTSTTSTTSAPSINNIGNCNNSSAGLITRTVHSIPAHLAPKGHALAPGSNQGGPPTYPPPAPVVHNSLAKGQTSNSVGLISSNQQNLSSSQLYQQKVQSETGQSVSVSNPVQKFYPPHQQNRNTVLPSTHATPNTINKDVENVRALGYPAGSSNVPSSQSATSAYYPPASNSSNSHLLASSSVTSKPYSSGPVISMSSMTEQQQDDSADQCVGKLKPILPPKPVVPSKPTPPPRQKGDPMASSTESINLIGVSNHRTSSSIRPHVFRYASQNVILSTYTQQQQQNNQQQVSATRESQSNKSTSVTNNNVNQINHEKQNHETSKGKPISKDGPAVMESTEDNLPPTEKVHISINRRIEMPPDFLFPEDATPPSDLLGRQLGDMARVDRIANENRGRHMEQSNDAKSSSETFNRQPEEVNSAKSTSDLGLQLNENVKQDSLVENNGYDTLDRISVSNHINNQNNNSNNTISNSVNNLNTINNNISAPSKELERLRINNATIEDGEKGDKEKEFEKADEPETHQPNAPSSNVVRRLKKGNLKTSNSSRAPRRVSFDPLALLLDASLEGELELVKRTATEVPNPSAANDEGITALHNAICAGHLDIVTFLVTFGCDVNAQDSDGWTPLHCAASCNNVAMVRFLVEHGACVLATTLSDHETAAEKCEQDEEGYDGCSQYLYSVQEKLGIMNGGAVYAVYDYDAQNEDELSFKCGDSLTVIRRGDEYEREWWWIRFNDKCGYVPRNLLGLCPRVKNPVKIS